MSRFLRIARSILPVILLSLLLFDASVQPVSANNKRLLVAVLVNDNPPMQFIDPKSGKAVGWESELLEEIARRIGADYGYAERSDREEALRALETDKLVDVAVNSIWKNRFLEGDFDFSDAYMRSEILMMVRNDEKRISDAASFVATRDSLLGVWRDIRYEYVAINAVLGGNEQSPRLRKYDSVDGAVEALRLGNVEAVLIDRLVGEGYVKSSGGNLRLVGFTLDARDYRMVLKKGSIFTKPINKAIAGMKSDGTIKALNKKWFLDFRMGK